MHRYVRYCSLDIGNWPRTFFFLFFFFGGGGGGIFMDRDEVEVHKNGKKERG